MMSFRGPVVLACAPAPPAMPSRSQAAAVGIDKAALDVERAMAGGI